MKNIMHHGWIAGLVVDSLIFLLYSCELLAGIAQLVEYKLPKLGVASSNLVARSRLLNRTNFFLGCSGAMDYDLALGRKTPDF